MAYTDYKDTSTEVNRWKPTVIVENALQHVTFKGMNALGRLISVLASQHSKREMLHDIDILFKTDPEVEQTFRYGLGGNHLWVHENATNLRIILVQFNE